MVTKNKRYVENESKWYVNGRQYLKMRWKLHTEYWIIRFACWLIRVLRDILNLFGWSSETGKFLTHLSRQIKVWPNVAILSNIKTNLLCFRYVPVGKESMQFIL